MLLRANTRACHIFARRIDSGTRLWRLRNFRFRCLYRKATRVGRHRRNLHCSRSAERRWPCFASREDPAGVRHSIGRASLRNRTGECGNGKACAEEGKTRSRSEALHIREHGSKRKWNKRDFVGLNPYHIGSVSNGGEGLINEQRLYRTFCELLQVSSPSFHEHAIGDVLCRELTGAGCRVEVQDYGTSFNVLAFKRGSIGGSSPLLLSAHMDTIEPTEGIVLLSDSGAIRTDGSTVLGADDKCALAQIIEALKVLQERGIPHSDIEVAFTSAEERGLQGAKNLPLEMIRSRYALVLDASGSVGSIIIAAPTHVSYEMKIFGRSAHAGIEPEKGLSAIRIAAEILTGIPDGRVSGGTTANVGVIGGGTASNVVPREVRLQGEIRSHSLEELEETRRRVIDYARAVSARSGARLDVSEDEEYRAFRIPESDPFIEYLHRVYTEMGLNPQLAASGGGSDANVFNALGIKAVNISTGMQKVHSGQEFVLLDDLYAGSRVVLNVIRGFSSFLGGEARRSGPPYGGRGQDKEGL